MTAAQLKQRREEIGMTQEDMALLLKTPIGTYRQWEHGRRRIPGSIDILTYLLCSRLRRAAP